MAPAFELLRPQCVPYEPAAVRHDARQLVGPCLPSNDRKRDATRAALREPRIETSDRLLKLLTADCRMLIVLHKSDRSIGMLHWFEFA